MSHFEKSHCIIVSYYKFGIPKNLLSLNDRNHWQKHNLNDLYFQKKKIQICHQGSKT